MLAVESEKIRPKSAASWTRLRVSVPFVPVTPDALALMGMALLCGTGAG